MGFATFQSEDFLNLLGNIRLKAYSMALLSREQNRVISGAVTVGYAALTSRLVISRRSHSRNSRQMCL